MTRKDFNVIAQILSYTEVKDKESITTLLQAQNHNFDQERFWKAVFNYQNGRL